MPGLSQNKATRIAQRLPRREMSHMTRAETPAVCLPLQVEFHHCGVCVFKGVPEVQALIQLSSRHLAARRFPEGLPSRKAKLVAAPQGLQCSISLS